LIEEELRRNPPPAPPPEQRVTSSGRSVSPGDIVVTGQRPRGSVLGDIPPERTFGPLDIRAYEANSIGELLQTLGPQVSSDRGREDSGPVVLLNGRRVASFLEIASIPTEAIERMEVFPEEVALRYGYPADQKVVNVVTWERYQARIGQLIAAVPTAGGREVGGLSGNYFSIRGDARLSVDGLYTRSQALLESDRGLIQPFPSAPDAARFRTLLPATEQGSLNAVWSRPVFGDAALTINGRAELSASRGLVGLGPDGPLRREVDRSTFLTGTTLSGLRGSWQWTVSGTLGHVLATTLTDTAASPGAPERARALDTRVGADLVLTGPLVALPAGPLAASVRAGAETRAFSSRSVGREGTRSAELSRDRASIQTSLDLPLASRRAGGRSPLGALSLNVNAELETLSDFSTLRTFGYGLAWSPVRAVSLIVSATHEEGAPSLEQLGAPTVVTPNVPTFDLARGEFVNASFVTGGNPDLDADSRQLARMALNVQPIPGQDLSVTAEFTRIRSERPIAPFPLLTPVTEAAFPGRFTRDASGRLVRIDARPINFARAAQDLLRFGINFTRPLGPLPPGMQNVRVFSGSIEDVRSRLPAGTRVIQAPPNSDFARRFENLASRLTLSLYYNLRLRDDILVREGGPVLDLLDGGAIDLRGGRPRHTLEFQAGASKRGLGARLDARWQSGTRVAGTSRALGGVGDLRFSDLTTVNLNLFVNLAERFGGNAAPQWMRGTRLSLGISNLFDARPTVRDVAGDAPFSLQPAYLDPIGRTVNLTVRKMF